MDSPLIALPADFIEMRRGHIKAYGPMTTDALLAQRGCTNCDELLATFALGTNTACGFKSVKELLHTASQLAANMSSQAPTAPCRACGGATKPVSVLYHAFHSGLAQDLVVHWKPKKRLFARASVELLKWNPFGGMLRAGELTADEASQFVHDAAFREAWASFEVGDVQNGVALVEGLCNAYATDPLLLRFVPLLIEGGYARLSHAIADNQRKLAPDDADGHYWSGEVLLQSMNHGVESPDRLPEVRQALEKALALREDHLPAALSLCKVLCAERRFDEAKSAFQKVVLEHPDCAEAHFNVAVMALEGEPQLALIHFQQGERLVPEDPDYPIGCARALLRLGRKDEARHALARGKKLTNAHPRFAELESALA
jgi:tetratricopeptide (TPR) repeat protein